MIIYKTQNTKRAFTLLHNESLKKQAVLSIEASVTLPLFLIAVVLLLSLSSVFYISERMEAAVCEEAKELACTSDEEIIEVSKNYCISFPFDVFGTLELPLESKAIMHNSKGYVNGLYGFESEEYVYMTENGTVYHKSRECSHIKLNIKKITSSELKHSKNSSGAKYKKCSYCKPKKNDPNIYVTSDGDRYHNTLSCSGLKRTVKRVRLSSIGSIPPCSKCGYLY